MEGFTNSEGVKSIKNLESEYYNRLKTKFAYLDKKINLVESAAKLNALNFYTRSKSSKCNLISLIVKYTYYKNRFDKDWKEDLVIIDKKLFEINDALENIIEKIEEVDCLKRDDDETYLRKGINHGREYIEKGLRSQFEYGIYF